MKCIIPPLLPFFWHFHCFAKRSQQMPSVTNSYQFSSKFNTKTTQVVKGWDPQPPKLCFLFSHSLHKWIWQIRICAPYSWPLLAGPLSKCPTLYALSGTHIQGKSNESKVSREWREIFWTVSEVMKYLTFVNNDAKTARLVSTKNDMKLCEVP